MHNSAHLPLSPSNALSEPRTDGKNPHVPRRILTLYSLRLNTTIAHSAGLMTWSMLLSHVSHTGHADRQQVGSKPAKPQAYCWSNPIGGDASNATLCPQCGSQCVLPLCIAWWHLFVWYHNGAVAQTTCARPVSVAALAQVHVLSMCCGTAEWPSE